MQNSYEVELSFPCGYSVKVRGKIKFSFFDMFSSVENTNLNELPVCPLHGKDCKGVRR